MYNIQNVGSGRGAETLSETSGRGKVERNTFPPNTRGQCQQLRNRSGKTKWTVENTEVLRKGIAMVPENCPTPWKWIGTNSLNGKLASVQVRNKATRLDVDLKKRKQPKSSEHPHKRSRPSIEPLKSSKEELNNATMDSRLDDLEKMLNNGPQPFNLKGSGGTWLMWQKTPPIKCQFVMEPLHSTVEVRATCKPPKIAKDLGKFGRKGQQAGDTKDTLRCIDRHFTGNVTHNFATTVPGDLLLTSATCAKNDHWAGVDVPSVTKEQTIPGASDDDDEPDF
eukprot:jgi/Bigna1/80221/fgenesh1_pg.69_\